MYINSEQLHPMPIVIVDDEPFNIAVLERMLRRAGYRNVSGTTKSSEAVTLATRCNAELLILDLHMPKPDGFEILEHIGGMPYPPQVLVLTADNTPATRLRALGAGARDFLARPIENVDLLLHTRNLLEMRYLHRALDRLGVEVSLSGTDCYTSVK